MKIGPSTIGAVVFTAVSVAAFGWMTQRPKASGQAIGFAMPSSGSASSSASSTSTDTPQAAADLSNSSATESATAEKTTEKVENTSTANDSDTSASTDAEAPASESQASTNVVAETEKTTESSSATNTDTINADSQASSNKALVAGATAAVAANSAGSTETSATESTVPATAQSSEAPSSGDQANSAATVSSTEQQSSEATTAPEPATSPETQTEPSSETTTANTSPAIQAIQLKSANGTSAGIYTAAANANGTVVILHGCDYKPEGEDNVVRPLHEGLPQEGWNTLSLQLPNLSASSSYKDLEVIMPDAAARIESGIAMAKEKSQTPVVLFAHGCGAQVALAWMEVKGSDSINGYIGLGAGVMNASANDASHLRLPLEKMKFPQLDIYGSGDNEAVLKTAPERLSHINRAANPASRQKKIEGADHNVTGKGKELSDVVVKWLNGLAFKK